MVGNNLNIVPNIKKYANYDVILKGKPGLLYYLMTYAEFFSILVKSDACTH